MSENLFTYKDYMDVRLSEELVDAISKHIPRKDRRFIKEDVSQIKSTLSRMAKFIEYSLGYKGLILKYTSILVFPTLVGDMQQAYRSVKSLNRHVETSYRAETNKHVETLHELFAKHIKLYLTQMKEQANHEHKERKV